MDVESKTAPSSRIGLTSNSDESTLRQQTERVMSEVRELGHVAKATTGEAIDHAKERGRVAISDARDQSRELLQWTNGFVQEHPLRSLAGAVAVGAILALLIKR